MVEDWKRRLRRAGLPGAAKVELTWRFAARETAFELRSLDVSGGVIGDDRDYDLLKAVMSPLENLAEMSGIASGRAVLWLETDRLDGPSAA